MGKYKAIKNNFGYLGSYWKKGEVVEAEELPNENWEAIVEADGSALTSSTSKKTTRRK